MFHISADNLHWIDGTEDDIDDLCLHGHATARIGNEIFEFDDATVSATGLYLLKSLTCDHIMGKEIQMLPCCGHNIYANETMDKVDIWGCDHGIDWTVLHSGRIVELITISGRHTFLPLAIYQNEVWQFADKIEAFYQRCSGKILPSDQTDRDGYLTFWKEWHRRRGQHNLALI